MAHAEASGTHPLDHPPLILRRGPVRPILLAGFSGLMALLGAAGLATGVFTGSGALIGGAFTAFFTGLAAVGLLSLFKRPYLQLSPEGLVASELHRIRRWRWDEFARFEAMHFTGSRWAVSFQLASPSPGVYRKLAGADGTVPYYVTGLHPRYIADLLNAALARWR